VRQGRGRGGRGAGLAEARARSAEDADAEGTRAAAVGPVAFRIPGYLSAFAGGRSRVEIAASPATVGDALLALCAVHPGLRDRILTEEGRLRPHVNVFVGRESIRWTGGLATRLPEAAEVFILPAVSGG
jgi:molybdopterin converting factor small subunit